jgi:hypothetical protein
MSFDKIYTRVPRSVYALQWLPFARLPNVTNIMGEVTEATATTYMGQSYNPADPFQPPRKPQITCIGGKVRIGDKERDLNPYDYVVYSCETNLPIQVIPEEAFKELYVDGSKFTLCQTCSDNIKSLNSSEPRKTPPNSIEEYIKILINGGVVTVTSRDTGEPLQIKTVQDFVSYLAGLQK